MSGLVTRGFVGRNLYRDSVFLLRVSTRLRDLGGIEQAEILTGTPSNLEALRGQDLLPRALADARPGPSDLVVAVRGQAGSVEQALREAHRLIDAGQPYDAEDRELSSAKRPVVRSLGDALDVLPDANLALISIPGPHVRDEAMAALRRGLNLLIFSSNVGLEDEVAIKREAARRGLLVMGPDCGTAMFRGSGLAFANAVRNGPVGLVGASGTGLQQVSTLVHLCGSGVSHIIGTGSRDVGPDVGGLTTLAGLDLLESDPGTRVVVIVSKPSHPETATRILERAQLIGKPVVACFLGAERAMARGGPTVHAATLEEAALNAVSLVEEKAVDEVRALVAAIDGNQEDFVEMEAASLARGQRFVRGLYCGGSLAIEAAIVLAPLLGAISGNFRAAGIRSLDVSDGIVGHAVLDLGDESFTRGRPHPMLAPGLRDEQILAAAGDEAVGVISLDFLLGYGAHPDPAGAAAPVLRQIRQSAADKGRHISIVATICGTDRDPQGLAGQEGILRDIGAVVTHSNANGARIAARILRGVGL